MKKRLHEWRRPAPAVPCAAGQASADALLPLPAVFMTAAGVVKRQRQSLKDQKAAYKAHAGKQLFPEVHRIQWLSV